MIVKLAFNAKEAMRRKYCERISDGKFEEAEKIAFGWLDDATKDPVSGALSRRGFALTLQGAYVAYARPDLEQGNEGLRARKEGRQNLFALIVLDIDRFKWINDTYGHEAGDVFLAEVYRALSNGMRETDSVARLGGDEFAVAWAFIDSPCGEQAEIEKMVHVRVDRILRQLKERHWEFIPGDGILRIPNETGEEEEGLSVSYGVAFITNSDELKEFTLALNAADQRMYVDKKKKKTYSVSSVTKKKP